MAQEVGHIQRHSGRAAGRAATHVEVDGMDHRRRGAVARQLQGIALASGSLFCVIAFYAYMLPGMNGNRLFGAIFLSPLPLAMVAPFTLHWLLVRAPVVGAVTAFVMAVLAIGLCLDILMDPKDRSAFLFILVPILAVIILIASVVASLIAQGARAAMRRYG